VTQFDKVLTDKQLNVQEDAARIRGEELSSKQREETTTRMLADLEKRIFECEKEKIKLRKKREEVVVELEKEREGAEQGESEKEVMDMIKQN